MRTKSLYLLIACVCGTVAALMAGQWLKAQAGSGKSDSIEIFVASVSMDIGEEITPEKIRLEEWPQDKIPAGCCNQLEQVEGKYAKQRVFAGEPIMPVKLMDENWTTVPKDYRVVAMKASDVSIANLIQPGDRVDVMAYFNKSELIPRSMLKTVLKGVRVYALDGDTERKVGDERPKQLRNIQLLIHEKDAEAWSYADELGNIRLSLGSDADYSNEDGSNQSAQEFLSWLEEYRKMQEEAAAEEKRLQALQNQPRRPGRPAQAPVEMKEENGFTMHKMVEGRMMEYWIVPGKLPVLVGEVGGEDSEPTEEEPKAQTANPTDMDADSLDYLNGEDSPFYQPSDRSGADRGRDY